MINTAMMIFDPAWRACQCLSEKLGDSFSLPRFIHSAAPTRLSLSKLQSISEWSYDILNITHLAMLGYEAYQTDKGTHSLNQRPLQKIPFYVKVIAIASCAGLFTYVARRKLQPKTDLNPLLSQAGIPPSSLKNFSIQWFKSSWEMGRTAIVFGRIALTLYRLYAQRRYTYTTNLPLIALDLFALYQLSQYKTIEIKRTFSDTSTLFSERAQQFAAPIKQIEVSFLYRIDSSPKLPLTDRIKAIYDYSSNMFKGSFWNRFWEQKTQNGSVRIPYVTYSSPPSAELPWEFYPLRLHSQLSYEVTFQNPPPIPFSVKILHDGEVWVPFKALEIFKLFPTFINQGGYTPLNKWVTAQVHY